jgi:glycosyltransferase involved in cell wall biosynthesis
MKENPQRLKIGIISTMSGFAWGGSEELWAATALEALNVGHEVIISVFGWVNESPKLGELEHRGATILRRYNPAERSSFRAASRYSDVFKTSPDVMVISQGGSFDVVWLPDLRELLNVAPIPFVLVCQFNENLPVLTSDYHREQACNIFSRAFRVLFVSNQNRIDAERQLARKIPNSDIIVNPVNLSDRSYVFWPDSKTVRFASVARLEARPKGQDILIEAFSAEEWRQRDWQLTLYGSGPDERYLRSLVEFFGLQDRITFAGYESDVRAIWAREQVLVMLSRAEGAPLAMVEAMLCGRPAIVSDVGGNREWVTESQTGFVAEAPVNGLARGALERAWSARENWKAMGMQAHKLATARISDPGIPGLLEVLLDALRGKRPADMAASEELERLRHYRGIMEPTIGRQAKRIVHERALHLRDILYRWWAARIQSQERCLQRLTEPKGPH